MLPIFIIKVLILKIIENKLLLLLLLTKNPLFYRPPLWVMVTTSLVSYLNTLNCSINFVVYCIMCSAFRQALTNCINIIRDKVGHVRAKYLYVKKLPNTVELFLDPLPPHHDVTLMPWCNTLPS